MVQKVDDRLVVNVCEDWGQRRGILKCQVKNAACSVAVRAIPHNAEEKILVKTGVTRASAAEHPLDDRNSQVDEL